MTKVKLGQFATSGFVPPKILEIPNAIITAVGEGYGMVKYSFTETVTGSAQNTHFSVSKAHRMVRGEFQQVVTSTGLADTTGLNLSFQRVNLTESAGSSGRASVILQATSGSVAKDSVVFTFSTGWEQDVCVYNIAWTGQNNDTLTCDLYIQYL